MPLYIWNSQSVQYLHALFWAMWPKFLNMLELVLVDSNLDFTYVHIWCSKVQSFL